MKFDRYLKNLQSIVDGMLAGTAAKILYKRLDQVRTCRFAQGFYYVPRVSLIGPCTSTSENINFKIYIWNRFLRKSIELHIFALRIQWSMTLIKSWR
jgi:hypothetical protein